MWPHDKGEDKSGKGNKCKTCLFFFLCDKVFVLISPSSLLQWASPPVHYLSPVNRPVLCGCDNKKHINHSFFFFCELLHRSNWNWFGVRDPPMKETTLRPILFSFKQLNSLSMDADFFFCGCLLDDTLLEHKPVPPQKAPDLSDAQFKWWVIHVFLSFPPPPGWRSLHDAVPSPLPVLFCNAATSRWATDHVDPLLL